MKRDIRRCEKCEHYKAYKTKSGVWAKACESWDCEFEPIKPKPKFAHISLAVTDGCKNLEEGFGEICVRCNECGRFDEGRGD